jgi:hypothetical protein
VVDFGASRVNRLGDIALNSYLYLLTPTAIVARISLFRFESVVEISELIIDLQVKLRFLTRQDRDCSAANCHRLVLDWTSLGSGKFGENPRLCRNCDGAKASSQNTGSEYAELIQYHSIHYF